MRESLPDRASVLELCRPAYAGIPGATLAACVEHGLRAEVAARRAVRVTAERRTALAELDIPRRRQTGEEVIFVVRAHRSCRAAIDSLRLG